MLAGLSLMCLLLCATLTWCVCGDSPSGGGGASSGGAAGGGARERRPSAAMGGTAVGPVSVSDLKADFGRFQSFQKAGKSVMNAAAFAASAVTAEQAGTSATL